MNTHLVMRDRGLHNANNALETEMPLNTCLVNICNVWNLVVILLKTVPPW